MPRPSRSLPRSRAGGAGATTSTRRPRIVVAGGGIAGVETLLALRELAGARVSIELLAPEPDLVIRPLAVAAPFGTGDVRRYPLDAICRDADAHLRRDALEFVDVVQQRVETLRGATIDYDALVVAVGARRRAALPGALTFDGAPGIEGFRLLLEDLASGDATSVAFAVPAGVTWPLPLYELALQTSATLPGTRIVFATPEPEPLAAFGGAASRRVRALLEERGIELRTHATPHKVGNGFLITSAGAIRADRVVALPALGGPRVAGLPTDPGGFLKSTLTAPSPARPASSRPATARTTPSSRAGSPPRRPTPPPQRTPPPPARAARPSPSAPSCAPSSSPARCRCGCATTRRAARPCGRPPARSRRATSRRTWPTGPTGTWRSTRASATSRRPT